MNKFLYTTILSVILSSCESSKLISNSPTPFTSDVTEIIGIVSSKNQNPKWLVLQGAANIKQKDQEAFVNINIISRKDSLIWLSARAPFGIEILRAQITPDTLFLINRLAKSFYKKPIKELTGLLNFDFSFYEIQDLINANPIFYIEKYMFQLDNGRFYLYSNSSSFSINKNYRIDNAKYFESGDSLEITLENYVVFDNFPREQTVIIKGGETLRAKVKYTKVDFKKPKKILFEIPKSYHEIY